MDLDLHEEDDYNIEPLSSEEKRKIYYEIWTLPDKERKQLDEMISAYKKSIDVSCDTTADVERYLDKTWHEIKQFVDRCNTKEAMEVFSGGDGGGGGGGQTSSGNDQASISRGSKRRLEE